MTDGPVNHRQRAIRRLGRRRVVAVAYVGRRGWLSGGFVALVIVLCED